MAQATVTVSVAAFPDGREATLDKSHVYGTFAVSTGTYVTNGLPVTFGGNDFFESPGALASPTFVMAYSAATGFQYFYDPVHGTLRIYEQGTAAGPLPELGNGANVTADTVYFHAVFHREG